MQDKTREWINGDEHRTITVGTKPDGRIYAREMSEGDLTEMAFDAQRRIDTITFMPQPGYDLADFVAILCRPDGDVYIDDFADSLDLFDVPYERREIREP